MKRANMLHVLGGIAAVMVLLTGLVSTAFFLTAHIYESTGLQPPALVAQIVNALLGLLFTYTILIIAGRVFSSKLVAQRLRWSGPIIQALDRIAHGDFSVRLEDDLHDNFLVSELSKSVNRMAVELEAMEQLRQEFISNVSHEIQSPLTSIRGFAVALRSDRLSAEERNHYLTIIESESQRLSRITDNLLKLASLESKQLRLDPKPYRLDKQIRDLILAGEPLWTGKGIEMDVALEEVTVSGDEDLLSQVWTNLINNAIKFTPEGGKISIGLCRKAGQLEFKITDTGIGIPEPDHARVFERFYKVDTARRRSVEGSGLGLAIVKRIVELHKGVVGVESKVDIGATFAVTLPMQ